MTIFSYCPTKKIFGAGATAALIKEIEAPARIALIASGSALKASGLQDELAPIDCQIRVRKIYHGAGEPDYLRVHEIAEAVREQKVTHLLCVGGGSIVDLTKAVAVCAHFPGSAEQKWQQLLSAPFNAPALPIFVVSTLPGTSSETNSGFVIKDASQYKRAISKINCFPQATAFDPKFASTVPTAQIRLSMFDAYVHVLEQSIRPDGACSLNDGLCVTAFSALLDLNQRTLDKSFSTEDLLRFSRLSSFIIDGATLGRGVPLDFVTHELAVFLSAHFQLAHGKTLACVLPNYLSHPANEQKCLRFECLMNRSVAALNELRGETVLCSFDLRRHIAEAGIVCRAPQIDSNADLDSKIASFIDQREAFWPQRGVTKKIAEEVLRNAISELNA